MHCLEERVNLLIVLIKKSIEHYIESFSSGFPSELKLIKNQAFYPDWSTYRYPLHHHQDYVVCPLEYVELFSMLHISELKRTRDMHRILSMVSSLPSWIALRSCSVVLSSFKITSSERKSRWARGEWDGVWIYLLVESIRYNYYILVRSVVVDEFSRRLDDFPLVLSPSQIPYEKNPPNSSTVIHSTAYPLRTPRTRLSIKNDPRIINGTKYSQLNNVPTASFVWKGRKNKFLSIDSSCKLDNSLDYLTQ